MLNPGYADLEASEQGEAGSGSIPRLQPRGQGFRKRYIVAFFVTAMIHESCYASFSLMAIGDSRTLSIRISLGDSL